MRKYMVSNKKAPYLFTWFYLILIVSYHPKNWISTRTSNIFQYVKLLWSAPGNPLKYFSHIFSSANFPLIYIIFSLFYVFCLFVCSVFSYSLLDFISTLISWAQTGFLSMNYFLVLLVAACIYYNWKCLQIIIAVVTKVINLT